LFAPRVGPPDLTWLGERIAAMEGDRSRRRAFPEVLT
jgi:hypothetical protein